MPILTFSVVCLLIATVGVLSLKYTALSAK